MPCVFCGSGEKLTKEHIVPQWLKTLFPEEGKVEHIRVFEREDGAPQKKEWEAYPFDMQKRVVCASCNNGWMSKLEAEVKPLITPMIQGKPTGMDIEAQAKIATWATKTALMLEHLHPDGEITIPAAAYRYLFDHRLPPANECVWLLRYEGEDQWPLSCHHYGIKFVREGEPEREEVNGHGVVIAVGHLGVHLFGHHIGENPLARCSSDKHATNIWPGSGLPVSWPPKESYRDAEALAVVAAMRP